MIVWGIPEVQSVEWIQEYAVETIQVDPVERVQQCTVVQVGNVQVPHFREQIAEVVTVSLQERISSCVSFENYHKRRLVQGFSKNWGGR